MGGGGSTQGSGVALCWGALCFLQSHSRGTSYSLQVQDSSLRSLYKRSAGRVAFTMDPVRDLLIWAVVQNRKELAEIIWAQVSEHRALHLS